MPGKDDSLDYSLSTTRFERRSWVAQRIGWGTMALIVAATAIGALGAGPVSRGIAEAPGLVLEYDAIARAHAPADFEWRLISVGTQVSIEVDSAFLDVFPAPQWTPEPIAMTATPMGLALDFDAKGSPVAIRMLGEPARAGRHDVSARTNGGEPMRFRVTVLP